MAFVVKDRVKETTVTTGIGTVTLLGAVRGFQSFSNIGNGNNTFYVLVDANGTGWEVGIGTYNSGTLTRDTILESSNSNAAINLSSGTHTAFCGLPADKAIYLNAGGNFSSQVGSGDLAASSRNYIATVASGIAAADSTFATITGNPYDNLNLSSALSGYPTKANNLSDLSSTVTARTNLGLGTASTLNSGNFFQLVNNLADGVPATMRSNLGLGDVATWRSGQVFFNTQLSGVPTAPTAANNTNTTQLATTQFVTTAVGNASGNYFQLVNQLADGNAVTMRSNLGLGQAALYSSGNIFFNTPLSGTPTAPTAAVNTNTTQIATTAYVFTAIANASGGVSSFNTRTGAVTFRQSDYVSIPAYSVMSNALSSTSTPSGTNNLILGVPGYVAAAGTIGAQLTTNLPNYYQVSLQNTNASGSTDFVVTADDGTDSIHYADFGMNGSISGGLPFSNTHAAYLYTTDNELDIAALGSSGIINFYTGATPSLAGSFDNFRNFNVVNTINASGGKFSAGVSGVTPALGDNTQLFATTAFVQAKTMTRTLTWVVDNNGQLIASGNAATLIVPYAANVTGWAVQADQSGSVGVTFYKQAYSTSTMPSSSAWCAGAALPTLNSGVAANSSTGLNYGAISANDQITMVASGLLQNVTRVTVELFVSASA